MSRSTSKHATHAVAAAAFAAIAVALGVPGRVSAAPAADLVITGAKLYRPGGAPPASALAVRGDKLVYVGDAAGASAYVGGATHVRRLGGRLVLPGLVDAHIHPLDTVDRDGCDLKNQPKSLAELSEIVRACVRRYHLAPGRWLEVYHWSYYVGNEPDATLPTLRAALDRGAPENPVIVLGDDAHRGAYNSAALALARNAAGEVVGLTKATLAAGFAGYSKVIGVDEHGEPNGMVSERAIDLIKPAFRNYDALEAALRAPGQITRRLNAAGVTAVLDARVAPEGLPVYEKLLATGKMTVRATLAQYYDPEVLRRGDGEVDYDRIVAMASAVRAKYAGHSLVRADTAKLYVDGGLEGDPRAVPPTLPNGAVLEPFLQPVFATSSDGRLTVTDYVDTSSTVCAGVRAESAKYDSAAAAQAFKVAHGFHPGQCQISSGELTNARAEILELARRLHLASFNLHIHVIGDRAVRTAVDAIGAARAADGISTTRDCLAHVELVHPDDVARIGRDHLYLAYTYSWAHTDPEYDLTVVPFIQKVVGNSPEALYVPGSYYERNVYPVRATRDAGAILVAGSDAPVNTPDAQPFRNMAVAISRSAGGTPPLNPAQAITITDVLDAYTLNGARLLGREREIGSLETGKSADFVIVDRDVVALGEAGKAEAVGDTRVLETWFRGRRVYRAPAQPASR